MKCFQCGSSSIAKDVKLLELGHGSHLGLAAYDNPQALVFKGTKRFKLIANVCGDCGFVMPSVSKEDARQLKRLHDRARQPSIGSSQR